MRERANAIGLTRAKKLTRYCECARAHASHPVAQGPEAMIPTVLERRLTVRDRYEVTGNAGNYRPFYQDLGEETRNTSTHCCLGAYLNVHRSATQGAKRGAFDGVGAGLHVKLETAIGCRLLFG